ncbi:MAG: type II secretion system F family protein [Phycisphaerales bacterium]|jgi:type IV pilus assembly protein PilC|nr:type II secretion system F family protein [Phycisphaerales bacterium]MBT7170652.1 type II secretion system F family protein [Phycisphaerales bacterium]
MPKFEVELQDARDSNQVTTEIVTAENPTEAAAQFRGKGYVLRVNEVEVTGGLAKLNNIRIESAPGLKDVLAFSKQLAVMIKAGISIRDAIEGIAEQQSNQRFKAILDQVRTDVEAGQSFSAALAKHPNVFNAMYVNMVRASELSGNFAHMLGRICSYLEQQDETRRMVRSAMAYPVVLFFLSIGALVFLLTWVLPKFLAVFEGKEDRLPGPTRFLMALSDFMVNQWYILILGAIILVVGFIVFIKTPGGRIAWHKFVLRVPVFSKMLRALYITRGLQAFGELINAGVPILDALKLTCDLSGNINYQNLWKKVSDTVREGGKIVQELQGSTLMPKSVIQMIAAGEESGRLGEVLSDISEYYEVELKARIKMVTGMIEPLMICFMGGVVGFIALSIITPIFTMQKIMAKG